MTRLLGRQSRIFNPTLNLSSVFGAALVLPPIPPRVNYGQKVINWGMMLNDQLGDCTCAAFYHAMQTWTMAAQGQELTEPDSMVEQLYELVGGYVPGDPSTDQGAVEQQVLQYVKTVGAPITPVDGQTTHKTLGFAEIDVRHWDDIKRAIYAGGGVYIGFSVPQYIMDPNQTVFELKPRGDQTIVGGHAIWVFGYSERDILLTVSWGQVWPMTRKFWNQFVDESYLIADPSWIELTGHTPANMSKQEFLTYLAQAH